MISLEFRINRTAPGMRYLATENASSVNIFNHFPSITTQFNVQCVLIHLYKVLPKSNCKLRNNQKSPRTY